MGRRDGQNVEGTDRNFHGQCVQDMFDVRRACCVTCNIQYGLQYL